MFFQKLTSVATALAAAGLLAWGASAALASLRDEPAKRPVARQGGSVGRGAAAVSRPVQEPPEASGKIRVVGRVLGPDGRPVVGAKINRTPATGNLGRPYSSGVHATTGADGGFRFLADKGIELTIENERVVFETTVVAATAEGLGAAWLEVPSGGRSDDLTLRMVEDEPINGRIIDLEGKAVPGATLQVLEVHAGEGESLDPWFEAVKGKKGHADVLENQYLSRATIGLSPKVVSDADGRFRVTGVGRNRLVLARIDGPTIVSQYLRILTRPGKSLDVPQFEQPRTVTTYYGSELRHVAAPCKPIVGVVRDEDTKEPLPGVTIRSEALANNPVGNYGIVQTVADAQGRYRLTGMPKGMGNVITTIPGDGQPYLFARTAVPDSPGLGPVTADIHLKRGAWIEGKITDKASGKPLQAAMSYFAVGSLVNSVSAGEDGAYRLVGRPGPGLLAVRHTPAFLRAPERDDEFSSAGVSPVETPIPTTNFDAVARVDLPTAGGPVTRNITLDPGLTFKGAVVGPDGKPLAGAWGVGLIGGNIPWNRNTPMKTAEFVVQAYNPRQPRDVLLQHRALDLVGVVRAPKEMGETVTVEMRPGATASGRLVDSKGRPHAGVQLGLLFRPEGGDAERGWVSYFPPKSATADAEGRFRLDALSPGYAYSLVVDGMQIEQPLIDGLRSDDTKNLGDVKVDKQ